MTAYYNEFDPFAAEWLRALIAAGLIAPGDVDTRSIVDVRPDDLKGYTQCHFFAGIGVWSYALRRAGWPDDRPVWTGSCPCQPFSAAGKGGGFDDERHLWPHFHYLIEQCRPAVVAGEQVASKDGLAWLDLVQADMEGTQYAFGAVDLCAAGVGAPHIRQRLWWIGERLEHAESIGRQQWRAEPSRRGATGGRRIDLLDIATSGRCQGVGSEPKHRQLVQASETGGRLADAGSDGDRQHARKLRGDESQHEERAENGDHTPVAGRAVGRLADANGRYSGAERQQRCGEQRQQQEDRRIGGMANTESSGSGTGFRGGQTEHGRVLAADDSAVREQLSGPTNGLWRDADWLFCRDGKWRPVEPRPQQMVDGATASLGRVRAGHVEDIEFEIAEWAIRHQADAGKALHDLRLSLSARAKREWPVGRLPGIHEAPVLLAFLRQLSDQGWAFSEGVSRSSEEATQARLRVLWNDDQAARPSCGRGLEEQQPGEPADPMRILSSILARHAQEAWGKAHETYATTGFPLAHAARSRVGRLRGYGNAIVAEAAVAFIEAYLETEADRHLQLTAMSDFTTDNEGQGIFA